MMNQAQYLFLLFLLMNSSGFTAGKTSAQEGQDHFIKIGSKYYLVVFKDSELNWFAAAHFCRSQDSELLTIESLAEKDALFSYLKNVKKLSYMEAWTSSNDLSVEGQYMSLNRGRPMLYTFWAQDEPNNALNAEDCVHVVLKGDSFTMNDNSCYKGQAHVICEKGSASNARDPAPKEKLNCDNVTESYALKKLVEIYLKYENVFNCRE
ncbi:C-type lectin 37Db-like isoform X1 [Bactrocera neohumeralis]|uniref:C-type lectin 37Db-like isoform X1 n=1 Tax=Bactrocera neohumeralis TaxID=98809 RepID=UPI002166AF30|nr:C-type lectin 37Db-like isoform X1 [Bactrocera neohumeralis]